MLWAWGYGGLEARCRYVDEECRGMEIGRYAAGAGTWRCLPQELGRRAAGVLPLFASRDLELGRYAVGLGTWRHVEV